MKRKSRPARYVRVRRPGSLTEGSIRPSTGRRVHITRGRVEQLRIDYPERSSSVDGLSIALKGSASPGDRLRLQGSHSEDAICTVGPDGSWTMPEVVLSPGHHTFNVVDVNRPNRSIEVVFEVVGLTPITVISPGDGEMLEARFFEITGKASPHHLISLRMGNRTLTESSDNRGSFRFKDVELDNWGNHHLLFFYAKDPNQGAKEIVLHWPGLELSLLVDPVTRARLEPGADVVRCDSCYTYCYRATWNRLRQCPRCMESRRLWERSDPRFHTPRADL